MCAWRASTWSAFALIDHQPFMPFIESRYSTVPNTSLDQDQGITCAIQYIQAQIQKIFPGGVLSKKNPITHPWIQVIWLFISLTYNPASAQIWKITNFFISSNIGDIKLCKFQGGSGPPRPPF